jgi:hypothetical protein
MKIVVYNLSSAWEYVEHGVFVLDGCHLGEMRRPFFDHHRALQIPAAIRS